MDVFIWSEHIWEVITTALLSMVPMFEGRYAISTGMAMGMPWMFTFILAFIFSTIPMPLIMWLLKPILKWLYTIQWKPIQRFAAWVDRRTARKAEKMESGALFALFVFVAVPLPGTGVWTGSAIATVLNMKKGPAMIAVVLGNLVACSIMLMLTMGVFSIFGL